MTPPTAATVIIHVSPTADPAVRLLPSGAVALWVDQHDDGRESLVFASAQSYEDWMVRQADAVSEIRAMAGRQARATGVEV